jgi:hypothetical protein
MHCLGGAFARTPRTRWLPRPPPFTCRAGFRFEDSSARRANRPLAPSRKKPGPLEGEQRPSAAVDDEGSRPRKDFDLSAARSRRPKIAAFPAIQRLFFFPSQVAAQTRMVSGGEFWPIQRELSRHLKYIARARIPEFESSHPSHAVRSPSAKM